MHTDNLSYLLFGLIILLPSSLPITFYSLVLLIALFLLVVKGKLDRFKSLVCALLILWAIICVFFQTLMHGDLSLLDLKELFVSILSSCYLQRLSFWTNKIILKHSHNYTSTKLYFYNTAAFWLSADFSPVSLDHLQWIQARPVGLFANPTENSIVSFLLCLTTCKFASSSGRTLLFYFSLLLAGIPIVLSGTRVVLIVVILALLISLLRLFSQSIKKSHFLPLVSCISVSFIVIGITVFSSSYHLDRYFVYSDFTRLSGRWELWKSNLAAFDINPATSLIFGTGRYGLNLHGFSDSVSDSSYLYVFLHYGLVSLLLLISFSLILIYKALLCRFSVFENFIVVLFVVGGLTYDIIASSKVLFLCIYTFSLFSLPRHAPNSRVRRHFY